MIKILLEDQIRDQNLNCLQMTNYDCDPIHGNSLAENILGGKRRTC